MVKLTSAFSMPGVPEINALLLNLLQCVLLLICSAAVSSVIPVSSVILWKAKCTLIDVIVNWGKKSHNTYKINFCSTTIHKIASIDMILIQYDMAKMEILTKSIKLKGLNQYVKIVVHGFEKWLYLTS